MPRAKTCDESALILATARDTHRSAVPGSMLLNS
jgi:hypothetical protein